MGKNKKIESILYIGKNGSGKTKCLEEIKKNKEKKLKITWKNKNENIIFIPTELLYDRELNDEGTYLRNNYAKRIKKLIQKIFGNLNQFNIELEEKYLNKKEDIKKFKFEVNNFFKNIQREDEDFIFYMGYIPVKEYNPLNLKLESKDRSSTGLNNYSLIKVLSELLKFAVEKNKKINNLDQYYLIIDEPEKFCHPQLIKKIALHLKNINKYINLIISTHSPIFFN
jgi:predicted ATP-binding protein involved in virulence